MKIDPAKIALSNARANKPARKSAFRREGVRDTVEFRRIAGLPRRVLELPSLAECEALSALLRAPGGSMRLLPIQAALFAELLERRGVVGPICAGGGKTLITLLAGEILEAAQPLVLVPSGLVDKTKRDFAALAKQWRVRTPNVLAYEMLGREQSADVLEKMRPDLIAADEAHRLKNKKAAVTKRVQRYMREHPSTAFLPFSGTLIGTSLREAAHLYEWALGEWSPVPRRHVDVEEWGLAVDVDVPVGTVRYTAGALAQLYNEDEARASAEDEVAATRRAVQRRVRETPGVVATDESFTGASLRVNVIPLDVPRPEVDEALELLDATWTTPDGHPISDAVTKWRHTIEIGAGFFNVWDPRPPVEWLAARRAWSATCRHILAHNQRALDSELQVVNAVRRGEYDDADLSIGDPRPVLEAWDALRPTFEPNTVPTWIDDAVIAFVNRWVAEGPPGIVWTAHVPLGERLAEKLDLPYYGRKGLDERGRFIEDSRPETFSIVASIQSSGTGRNLQAWNRSLVIPAGLGGVLFEQLLARTHREGQRADEVTYDVLITCARAYSAYLDAREEATFIQDTQGQPQRILFADTLDTVNLDHLQQKGARWRV